MRIKWTTVLAAAILFVGLVTAGIAATQDTTNWAGLTFGGVLVLAGVGVSVLSLHER